MGTEKLNPKGLPFGYKKEIAKRLGVHPNTVYSILQTGERHPKWWRVTGTQIQSRKESFTDVYSKRLEHTSIFCRDALDVIIKSDHEDTFHYIDPPYFQADMGHYGGYTIEDFKRLLQLLTNLEGKFMLSSYPSDTLTKYALKQGWNVIEYDLPRAAGGGRKVEVLTMNYQIKASSK